MNILFIIFFFVGFMVSEITRVSVFDYFTLVDLSSMGREFQILEVDIETIILNVHMLYKFTHCTYHGIGQLFTTFFHRNPI